MNSTALISVAELHTMLEDPDLLILDASMEKPLPGTQNQISGDGVPGAIRFDLETVFSNVSAAFPHTRLSVDSFQKQAKSLGINNRSRVVVYDNMGIYSSPRAWWMLKWMGHNNVFILDGGLPAWINAGYTTSAGSKIPSLGDFDASVNPLSFIDVPELLNNLQASQYPESMTILDARSPGRFLGLEPEPRAGVRSGHIPGAKCLHFRLLTQDGFLVSPKELAALFAQRAPDKDSTLVFSCGSGITACILALGAHEIGYEKLRVFDGSWAQWGATHALPVE